jgi:hypothetical protein
METARLWPWGAFSETGRPELPARSGEASRQEVSRRTEVRSVAARFIRTSLQTATSLLPTMGQRAVYRGTVQ